MLYLGQDMAKGMNILRLLFNLLVISYLCFFVVGCSSLIGLCQTGLYLQLFSW